MHTHLPDPVPAEQAQPGDLIGYTKHSHPIYLFGGGAPDGDDGGEGDGDPTDDTPDGDDTDEGEGEEETVDWQAKFTELQAQYEASQANLTRARKQAQKLREQQKAAATPTAPAPPAAPAATPAKATRPAAAPEPQVVTVQDDAEVQRLQGAAVRAYAKAALLANGCDPDLIDAPLSRLRSAEVEWDDDENEPILDEYLEDMKARYPKAFVKPEPPAPAQRPGPRRPGGIDQGASTTGGRAQPHRSFGQTLIEASGTVIGSDGRLTQRGSRR